MPIISYVLYQQKTCVLVKQEIYKLSLWAAMVVSLAGINLVQVLCVRCSGSGCCKSGFEMLQGRYAFGITLVWLVFFVSVVGSIF